MATIHPVPAPRKLPMVLSRDEVTRLISSAGSPKYQAALSVAAYADLRAGEVVALKETNVDSARMALHVEQGKGTRSATPCSRRRCSIAWALGGRRHAPRASSAWTFAISPPEPLDPLSTRQLNRAIHAAADVARIDKRVFRHTIRHSFATHLLEQQVDIRVIQTLLGHRPFETTALYAQVATGLLREVISPLDTLQQV